MRQLSNSTLKTRLEALYAQYNRPEYIAPDPLQFLSDYEDPADREIVGLIASSLAFGNVKQIVKSIAEALERIPQPRNFIAGATESKLRRAAAGFRHRYASQDDLAALLIGIRSLLERDESLESAFTRNLQPDHATVLPALAVWTERLRSAGGKGDNCLLPAPSKGSACKRLNLYLRWMVRRDVVDPGGWAGVPASKLIVPLDTHMYRIATRLGFTTRKQADMKTVLEVTARFREICPADPVRYDFALTRLGIRDDTDMEAFLRVCGLEGCAPQKIAVSQR